MSELSVGSWELLKVVLNDFAPPPSPPPPPPPKTFGNVWKFLLLQLRVGSASDTVGRDHGCFPTS